MSEYLSAKGEGEEKALSHFFQMEKEEIATEVAWETNGYLKPLVIGFERQADDAVQNVGGCRLPPPCGEGLREGDRGKECLLSALEN